MDDFRPNLINLAIRLVKWELDLLLEAKLT